MTQPGNAVKGRLSHFTKVGLQFTQGRTVGKSGTDYQGPNGGGGPRKACNKNVGFIYLFFCVS